MKWLLFLIPLVICGHPYTYLELTYHCQVIRSHIMRLHGCTATAESISQKSIISYLEKIPTANAQLLLNDLKQTRFNFILLYLIN